MRCKIFKTIRDTASKKGVLIGALRLVDDFKVATFQWQRVLHWDDVQVPDDGMVEDDVVPADVGHDIRFEACMDAEERDLDFDGSKAVETLAIGRIH